MDIFNTILFILILGLQIYQNTRIKVLKETIASQSEILDKAKLFINLFDVKKLEEYTKINIDAVEKKKEIEITQIKEDLEKKLKDTEATHENFKREMAPVVNTFIDSFDCIPPHERRALINRLPDEHFMKGSLIRLDESVGNKWPPYWRGMAIPTPGMGALLREEKADK